MTGTIDLSLAHGVSWAYLEKKPQFPKICDQCCGPTSRRGDPKAGAGRGVHWGIGYQGDRTEPHITLLGPRGWILSQRWPDISNILTHKEQGVQKAHFPSVRAGALLDLPLEVKLPVIPGSNNLYYTTKLNRKLFQPSYGFNLTDPYCRLLDNQYNSLHDPHLRAYHSREDIRRRLRKGGYITRNNEVVCNLKEFNKYRQYLTSLKLDFERHYLKEQEMLAKQINEFQINYQLPKLADPTQSQNLFLWENVQSYKDQEPLIRPRYLDMISRKLDHRECTAEEQHLLWMEKEKNRHWEQARKKHSLLRKFEEEWKTKEKSLLTETVKGVNRESGLEEQLHLNKRESDKKKKITLENKRSSNLPKKQGYGFIRKDMGKNTCDSRGHDGIQCECKNFKS